MTDPNDSKLDQIINLLEAILQHVGQEDFSREDRLILQMTDKVHQAKSRIPKPK